MEPTIINIGKVDNTTKLQNSALLKMKLLGMPETLLPSLVLRIWSTAQNKWQEMMFKKRTRPNSSYTQYIFEGANTDTATLSIRVSNPDYSPQVVKNAELQAVVEEFSLREIADNALPTTPALKYGEQSRYVFMQARVSDNVKVFIPVTSGGNPWVADAVETTEGDDIVTFRPDYTVLASETKELIGIINPGEQHEVVIDDASLLNNYDPFNEIADANVFYGLQLKRFFKEVVPDLPDNTEPVMRYSADLKMLGEMPAGCFIGFADDRMNDKTYVAFVGDGQNIVDVKGNKRAVGSVDLYYFNAIGEAYMEDAGGVEMEIIRDRTVVIKGLPNAADETFAVNWVNDARFCSAEPNNMENLVQMVVAEKNWDATSCYMDLREVDGEAFFVVVNGATSEIALPIIGNAAWGFVIIDSMSENPTFTLSNRYNDLLVEGIETVKIPQNEYDQICSPVDETEY